VALAGMGMVVVDVNGVGSGEVRGRVVAWSKWLCDVLRVGCK
jgi:hypothetical protein